jgi:adenylosuccinate synthase
MQALADMGVPASMLGHVYAVIRPYPIRVNNRDGSSGPYPSAEITWEEVRERCGAAHDITEITTTTKLQRRVFEFAWERIRTMTNVCNPDFFILQFANYIDWTCFGAVNKFGLGSDVMDFVEKLEEEYRIPVAYVGTGPEHDQMVDMGVDK